MVAPLLTHQIDLDVSADGLFQGDGTVGALAGHTVGSLSGTTVGQLVALPSNETITPDVLLEPGPAAERGRDRVAQDAPPLANELTWTADNRDGRFSPDSATSPIRGGMRVGRRTRWQIRSGGTLYAIGDGALKEMAPDSAWGVEQVRVRALSPLAQLVGQHAPAPDPALPVPQWARLWAPLRTDQALRFILEAGGLSDATRRLFDVGDTTLLYFWIDPDQDLFDLAVRIWAAEGAGARLYDDPEGVTIFKRRSSEIIESRFTTVQATFTDRDDGLNPWYAAWSSSAGERLMVNQARIDVIQRVQDTAYAPVARAGGAIALGASESRVVPLRASGSDPILESLAPVLGTDYALSSGTLAAATIGPRTNGIVVDVRLTAGAGGATVTGPTGDEAGGFVLRGRLARAVGRLTVTEQGIDTSASIAAYGPQPFTVAAWPELDPLVARSLCNGQVLRGSSPRPTANVVVPLATSRHVAPTLERRIGDRVAVVNQRTSFSRAMWVEAVRVSTGPEGTMVELGCQGAYDAAVGGAGWSVGLWGSAGWAT